MAKALPVLTAELTSPLVYSSAAKAEALGEIGRTAKTAVPALELAAKDDDKSGRDAAAKALSLIRR